MDQQPRALRLSSPYLRGPDVVEVQRLLGVPADGVFGPVTRAAVAAWKRSRGDPAPTSELSAEELAWLRSQVPLRAVLLMERWAAEQVGEEPPRSNRVPELTALAVRLGVMPSLAAMGYPWCAFAVFLAALARGGESAARGLRGGAFNAVYTPAVLAAAKAGSFGLEVVPAARAFRGDLVLFDWDFKGGDPTDHVGRLLSTPVDGRVHSVDGNAGGDGAVALRERGSASVRAFVRDS